MPSLFFTSRLSILPGVKKRRSRIGAGDTGGQFGGGPGASSLPTPTAAPASNTGLRLNTYDEQKNSDHGSGRRDARNIMRKASSSDSISIGKYTRSNVPLTPAPTVSTPSPLGELMSPPLSDSRHLTASPSRIARKASKIGSNIISDVKAGGASLFGGMGRSQQSQMDSDMERMERLGKMGILSTNSSAVGLGVDVGETFSFDGHGCDKEEKDAGYGHRITPRCTKGIMKRTTTTCPEIQVESSRSIMNPKMVDPKPSVRFTLDLPPKLNLDLTLSGTSLDKDLGRSTKVEIEVQSTSGGWAERTAAAVLDKSRGVEINPACVEKYLAGDGEKRRDKISPTEMPEEVEKRSPTNSNPVSPNDSAIPCPTKDAVTAAESQVMHIDHISPLDPIEPDLTVNRLEDSANVGSYFPSKSSSRESSVHGFALSPPLSQRTSNDSKNSRRSSIFDVRRQARADIPTSLIKLRTEGGIEETARNASARRKIGEKELGVFKDDDEHERLSDCVIA